MSAPQLELELFTPHLDETPQAEPAGSAPVLDLVTTVNGILGELTS